MAKLVFRVQADYEEVIKLRNEIEKLKKELKSMDATQSPAAFKALNAQLSTSTKRMDELVGEAAKAGAVMEGSFKKKIFDASQVVNGFTEKIIAQKAVVKDIEADVRRLGDAYRTALKRNPLSASGKLEEYNAARKALDEEKAALFGLTQQQAEARLSVKKLRDEYALYKNDAKEVVETNNGIAISWKKALAVIGGAGVLKALGSEMIRVRGEFQSMQTTIVSMVGKDMAGQLIPQIKELAKISPLTMSDMVGAEKMMLGFNIQAEDTIKYLKALSDISMGESGKFNSLTLAFSQMSAAGKLMGQDLNQMINAGFNPLQIMSEKTGKSIATLKDEMSKGAISAEMVQQAFIDATSAGGRFYQMSENASKTINGQLSMMQDAIDTVFNELGTKSEDVIMDGIQMTTSLIENYETVGKVLAGLVVTYGTYRTAMILTTIATSKHTIAEIALTNARVLARKAQMALNAAMLTNPYVLLATAVVGLGTAMWTFHDSATEAEKAQRRFNEQQEEAKKQEEEHKRKIDSLVQSSRDIALSDLQRGHSLAELRKEYPKIFAQYDIESIKLADILKLKQQIAEEDAKRAGEKQAKEFSNIESEIKYYENLLKSLSGQQGIDGYVKKLKELRAMRDVMLQDKGKGISEQFISNLNNVDVNEFDRYISELEKRIKGKGENGTVKLRLPIDIEGTLSDEAIYNIKDIKTLIDTAKSTKQTRIDSEKNKTTYKQDYDKAKKEWEDAKKKLSEIEKDKSKFTSKQYEEAKKREETTEKAYKDLGGITGSSLTKQQKEANKQLKQQEKLAEQLLSLRRKNQQDEIGLMADGTEKKLAQIDLDYQKELDAIKKQKAEWEKAQGGKLTEEQTSLLGERASNNAKGREKAISDVNKEELEAMNHYLREYGTFQQKKEAIAKEYADKIAQATTEGDKKLLQKEMEETIQSIGLSELKQSMDWEQVFGNLDKVSTDTLKRLKDNLKGFISEQKNLSPENLKELVDAIERIDDKVSERNPFESMSASFKSLKEATNAQREAQEAYNKALKEGTDEEKKNTKATLESAKNSKQKALYEATDALHKGINEIGQYVNAGNEVIGIMETLGVKTPEWLEGTMSGFGEMLNGLGSIDLMKPMSIVTGGLQTIKGALTSITSLGGVINWSGSNAKEVQKTIDRLTERNEILGKSIDRLTDIMEKSAGSKAISAYEEARKNQQEKNENLLDIAQAQASYYNSHKSWQYYMRWTDEQLKWAQENVDASFTGTNSLWNLTPEQMNKLLSNVNIYEQIKNAGKGGYGGRVMEDLEEYAEQAGKIADLEASINESLMNVSFDSLRSSFLDSLMDMEKDAKEFSDDFSEMLQRALLDFSLGETFDNELKDWYNDVAKAISDNSGKLSETQMDDFKKRYDDIVNAAMYERDKIAELTGYTGGKDDTREASQKGIATASQDSVDENNGRLAVMQGHTYSINENVSRMSTGIDTIVAHTVNLSYLTNIDKTMQSILSMRDASLAHLSNIDSHTARLEAIENAIVFMKNDINTMLIKGLKLSKN